MKLKLFDGIATLLGAIIGAGVLGIPYVVAKAGVTPGLVMILVLGIVCLIMNLMLTEVVLRTHGDHQLTGYARRYLGKWGGWLMLVSVVVGVYGALAAYGLGLGASLAHLVGGSPAIWMWIALGVLSILLAQRLEIIELSERYLSAGKVLLVVVFAFIAFSSSQFTHYNFTPVTSWTLPFGVILFSLLGTAVIPEVREELWKTPRLLGKAVFWGSAIPIVLYALFALAVIGVTGSHTTEIASVGLGTTLGTGALVLLNLFAVLALGSAFLALGEALKKTYEEDYGRSEWFSFALTLTPPALLLLLGATSFIGILGLTGAIAGGIDGIVIVLMYWEAKRKGTRRPEFMLNLPKAVDYVVIAVFAAALVWGVSHLF